MRFHRLALMESDRKQDLRAAEAAFVRKEKLSRRLAEKGVYVIGPMTLPVREEWEDLPVSPLVQAEMTPGDTLGEPDAVGGDLRPGEVTDD